MAFRPTTRVAAALLSSGDETPPTRERSLETSADKQIMRNAGVINQMGLHRTFLTFIYIYRANCATV